MTVLRTLTRRIILNFNHLPSGNHSIKTTFTRGSLYSPVTRKANYHVSSPRRSTDTNDEDQTIYDRDFVEMKIGDYEELYAGQPEIKEKIEAILAEYEHIKYNTIGRVPTVIDKFDMRRLIEECSTNNSRVQFINFLFKREMEKRAAIRRKEQHRLEMKAKKEAKFGGRDSNRTGLLSDSGDLLYGLWHNSLFCRIPENKIKTGSSSSRLRNAALFGRKLIFDFDFEDYMVKWTYRNAVDQVQEAYGINRFGYRDPFDIWFCNFKPNSFATEYCEKKAINNLRTTSMITVKEDCFTNHFDKSRLVYLSPNAKEPLGKIHKSDDIYIIGVYNDKGNQQPVTYRKATKLGIRSKCLPLDSHVVWASSSKSLCVNHVTAILLEVMANGGDWQSALMKHIPQRKIKPLELVMEEEQRRLENIRKKRRSQTFSLRTDIE